MTLCTPYMHTGSRFTSVKAGFEYCTRLQPPVIRATVSILIFELLFCGFLRTRRRSTSSSQSISAVQTKYSCHARICSKIWMRILVENRLKVLREKKMVPSACSLIAPLTRTRQEPEGRSSFRSHACPPSRTNSFFKKKHKTHKSGWILQI
jgi:hypothetical protein